MVLNNKSEIYYSKITKGIVVYTDKFATTYFGLHLYLVEEALRRLGPGSGAHPSFTASYLNNFKLLYPKTHES